MIRSTIRSAVRSAIRGAVRSDVILPEWTPIFDGLTTYGELYSAWQPSGNDWEVEVEGYGSSNGQADTTEVILSFGAITDAFIGYQLNDDVTYYTGSVITQTIEGVTNSPFKISASNEDGGSFSEVNTVIGALASDFTRIISQGFQIQRIKLLDNYDTGRTEYPVNGRDVVELDGLTQYGEIPEVTFSGDFDIYLHSKIGSPKDSNGLVANGEGLRSQAYMTSVGNIVLRQDGSGGQAVTPAGAVTGDVQLIRLSRVGSTFNIYVDGVLSGTNNNTNNLGVFKVNLIGGGYGNLNRNGFIANLRLTDLDNPSNSRYYPLDRADIIQATPVLQEVPIQYDTNGTVTYDWADDTYFDYLTEVDPKYGDVAPDVNEAVARALEDELSNGDFRFGDDGNWGVTAGGWAVSNGEAVCDGTHTVLSRLTGSVGVVDLSLDYEVTLDIKVTSGLAKVILANSDGGAVTESGVQKFIIHPVAGSQFRLDASVGFVGTLNSVQIRKVTTKVVTERTISSAGIYDGNWINAPQAVHRPNNSIDINTVKRSKSAPLASDNKLVNKLDGQEVGELVNLTGYELVNRGE